MDIDNPIYPTQKRDEILKKYKPSGAHKCLCPFGNPFESQTSIEDDDDNNNNRKK